MRERNVDLLPLARRESGTEPTTQTRAQTRIELAALQFAGHTQPAEPHRSGCISLMINDAERLFMCFSGVYLL